MPQRRKTNRQEDITATLLTFRQLLEGLSDEPVPPVVLPLYADDVPEQFVKRMAIVQGLQVWRLWAENGSPPTPDPFDTSISKRQWEEHIGRVKLMVMRRAYRKLGVNTMANSISYDVAGRPVLPNHLDDSIDDDEWNILITVTCELLDASHVASKNFGNETQD